MHVTPSVRQGVLMLACEGQEATQTAFFSYVKIGRYPTDVIH